MLRSNCSPEQMFQGLRLAEGGTVVAYICRKLGVAEATFYCWEKQYSGLIRQRPARA